MLKITVLGGESYNEETNEFVYPDSVEIELEHSLAVLSDWEARFEKPYLTDREKSQEEVMAYVQMMIQTPGVDPNIIYKFSEENFEQISAYMNAKHTATWFADSPGPKKSGEVITADLVYYWMSSFRIDLDFQHKHINQLFTVIRIHSLKNQKPKKMSKADAMRQQRELNAQRRKDMGTSG